MSTTTEEQPEPGPSRPTPKQKLVYNERIRLWATALNDGAVAAVVAAVVGPTAAGLMASPPQRRHIGGRSERAG